jgi:hypothetical protein
MSSIAMSASATVREKTESIAWGRYALVGIATLVAAVIANVLVYFAGDALAYYDPQLKVLATVEPTISVTLMSGFVALLTYAALLRFSRNPVRVYTIVSVVVLLISIVPDITYIPSVEGASNAQTAILILMHVVAAAVIVPLLTTFASPQALSRNRQEKANRDYPSTASASYAQSNA